MELREHLRGLFKLFEMHGATLRQRYPGLKRSIKYEDVSQSLCMDVMMPDKDRWHRIGEVEMREIARRHGSGGQVQGAGAEVEAEDRRRILGLDEPAGAVEVPVVEEEKEEQ